MRDVFADGLKPVRLVPGASPAYFEPKLAEFEPRAMWSLHNALTSAAREMPMSTRLPAIRSVDRLFSMSSEEKEEEGQLFFHNQKRIKTTSQFTMALFPLAGCRYTSFSASSSRPK